MIKTALTLFPYKTDASGNTYPLIPLSLKSINEKKELLALVDSGASISIFRAEVAESLGIHIEKGKMIYLGGVGGRIKGYIHIIRIEIAGKEFSCPIVFSHEYLVSFNLLGRKDVFNKFKIVFDEKNSRLSLK